MQPNTSPWRLSACACAFLRSCLAVYYTIFSARHVAQLYIFSHSHTNELHVSGELHVLYITPNLLIHTPRKRVFPFSSSIHIRFIRSHRPHAAPSNFSKIPYRDLRKVVLLYVAYFKSQLNYQTVLQRWAPHPFSFRSLSFAL